MKQLSANDLPKAEAVKFVELGYAAGNCQTVEQFETILGVLTQVFPIHGIVCGVGRFANGLAIDEMWRAPKKAQVTIDRVMGLNWPQEFLETYVRYNLADRDGQLFECLRTQQPTIWIDVYRRNKHNFNTFTKRGFDPRLVELIFDCKDDLTLRQLPIDAKQDVTNFSLAFRQRREALRFRGLVASITPHLHNALIRCLRNDHVSSHRGKSLTEMECEVLKWLIEGKSNWEISHILSIAERTVKFHLQNLMQKLGAINRYQLVAIAYEKQISGTLH